MRYGKTLRAAAACALLGVGGLAGAAADRAGDYALRGSLAIKKEAPFQRVALPMEVYLAAHERGLADLRVFNGKGELVQFALAEPTTRTESARQRVEARAFPLRTEVAATSGGLHIEVRRDDNGMVVAVDEEVLGKPDAPVHGYLIDTGTAEGLRTQLDIALTPTTSGFHRIDIEASEDLVKWTPLVNGAVLAQFAYGKELLRRQGVELPATPARYLRLNWREPVQAAELAAVLAQIDDRHSVPPPRIWSEALPLVRQANGEYRLQLEASVPADRLQLQLTGKNVLAPVTISERQTDSQPWRALTSAVAYRLSAQGQEWVSPDIELWGGQLRQLRFQFDAKGGALGDAPPMVRLGLRPRELIFLARGQGPFTLAVGQSGVQPDYMPVGTLVPGYGSDAAPPLAQAELTLGEPGVAPPSGGGAAAADEVLPRKWLLWAVLVIAVLGLAGMAFSLLRQTRKKDAED